MRYYKLAIDGYLIAIGKGTGGEEITEEEYNNILKNIIFNEPLAPDGFKYVLKEDLAWELVEVPPVDESPEQTPEERIAELEEALEMLMSGVTE